MGARDTIALDLSRLPTQWRDFVSQSLGTWHAENFAIRRSLGGKSGAVVILVDIKTPNHEGQGILKLSDGESLDGERERLERARFVSKDLMRRIPVVTHSYSEESRSALLMTVAGHGLLETEVMANAT